MDKITKEVLKYFLDKEIKKQTWFHKWASPNCQSCKDLKKMKKDVLTAI